MKIKLLFFLFLFFFIPGFLYQAFAQETGDSIISKKKDTNGVQLITDTVKVKKNVMADSAPAIRKKPVHPKVDTAKNIISTDSSGHNIILKNPASIDSTLKDTIPPVNIHVIHPESFITNKLLANNRFINVKNAPTYLIQAESDIKGKEFLFYTLCIVVLILGIFKTFYDAYFKNIFRVYFNTSLRQTQLADQLVQAKFPSFILNIFFALTTGIYIWLLFSYYHPPRLISNSILLPFCILSVAFLYLIKFFLLKFMGWVSDIQQTTDNYIFAIFLINKMIGILLVPVIILMAFLKPSLIPVITNISFMLLALLFLSRYVKSYGAIERKIPLNAFHFIIYIAGAEIIPLIILYKIAVDYLI